MAITSNITGSGSAALNAQAIQGFVFNALTTTGAQLTQANGFPIPGCINEFTTVAASSAAVLRANLTPSDYQEVYNFGGQALLVFPPVGESINALSANASLSVANGGKAIFKKVSNTRWVAIVSA